MERTKENLSRLLVITLVMMQCLAKRNPMENPGLFEGDMVLTNDQKEAVENGATSNAKFAVFNTKPWPLPIFYEIAPGLRKYSFAVKAIKSAIKHYEEKTCLRFQESENKTETLYFYKGKGCWSYVGYIPNRLGPISLGFGCWRKGIVIHEMAHALGFFHEQSRPDRDDYVTILWDNIPKYFRNQFKKYTLKHIDSLRIPYDYTSVMHYNRHQFGGDKPTIETKDPAFRYKIGQKNGLSHFDILQFGILYKCPGYTKPPPGKTLPLPTIQTKKLTTETRTTEVHPSTTPISKQPKTELTTTKPSTSSTPRTTLKPVTGTTKLFLNTMFICEDRTRGFACRIGYEVRIFYALYGRTTRRKCYWRRMTSTNCRLQNALEIVKAKCEGQRNCRLTASDEFFGKDPCPGNFKYLEVKWNCFKKNKD